MPTYEFTCKDCQTRQEVQAAMADQIVAPLCHQCNLAMTRNYGIGAVTFNGTGWGKD